MNRHRGTLLRLLALPLAASLLLAGVSGAAASGRPKTTSRILYHDGPVLPGSSNVYFIYYGCWAGIVGEDCPPGSTDPAVWRIMTDLVIGLSGSPYLHILTTYPDFAGAAPKGGLMLGPSRSDLYSHGATLSQADVENVVRTQVLSGNLPLDPRGIYIVLTSSDVTFDGFCSNVAQYHGTVDFGGTALQYAIVGNPERCPTLLARQFLAPNGSRLPTPNDNFAADVMASSIAHAINGAVTNPDGAGWFDRYGLENSDKCQGTYGQTYATPNGARANLRLGARDYLIQQNWVNAGKGYCALSYP